uniref:Uncharacterized protein n=1 Tax=Anguilla anguilla TaxID=7936 RepID=A0A0E9UU64_ANGAN
MGKVCHRLRDSWLFVFAIGIDCAVT